MVGNRDWNGKTFKISQKGSRSWSGRVVAWRKDIGSFGCGDCAAHGRRNPGVGNNQWVTGDTLEIGCAKTKPNFSNSRFLRICHKWYM